MGEEGGGGVCVTKLQQKVMKIRYLNDFKWYYEFIKRSLYLLLTTCMRRHFKYDFSARRNRSTVILRYGSTHWSTCPLQFWNTTWMSFGAGSISLSSIFLSAMICIIKTTRIDLISQRGGTEWKIRQKISVTKKISHGFFVFFFFFYK